MTSPKVSLPLDPWSVSVEVSEPEGRALPADPWETEVCHSCFDMVFADGSHKCAKDPSLADEEASYDF